MERPADSTRVSHRTQNSQDDFAKRWKHLQRSDPVDPQELTQRLNAAIVEARNYEHRDNGRRRFANARDVDGERSRTRTPSAASSPRQDVRQSMLNPLYVARSTLIFDPRQDDDDPITRVANALKALKGINSSGPPSRVTSPSEAEVNQRTDYPWSQRPDSRSDVNRTVGRRTTASSTSKLLVSAKRKEPIPRPQSSHPQSSIADAFQKRASQRAPAPIVLTVMPKAVRGNMVDVSSPLTTKAASGLPDLEPLSPFRASFSENGGSFLVYQPEELRHSHAFSETALELSADQDNGYSTATHSLSKVDELRLPEVKGAQMSPDHIAQQRMKDGLKEERQVAEEQTLLQARCSENERREVRRQGNGPRRRSIPSARLSQNSGSDGTDDQSDQGMSAIFETSAAQSSRTSLGYTSNSVPSLPTISSKRIGFTPGGLQNISFASGFPEDAKLSTQEAEMFASTSPLQLDLDAHPSSQQGISFPSPHTQQPLGHPNRTSSLPQGQMNTISNQRQYTPRKPVASSIYDSDFEDGFTRQVFPERPIRHDSTGFTVAREFLRDSIGSEHVRHVHTAARRANENETDIALNMHHLPKLTTSMSRPGKMEEIADGISEFRGPDGRGLDVDGWRV